MDSIEKDIDYQALTVKMDWRDKQLVESILFFSWFLVQGAADLAQCLQQPAKLVYLDFIFVIPHAGRWVMEAAG